MIASIKTEGCMRSFHGMLNKVLLSIVVMVALSLPVLGLISPLFAQSVDPADSPAAPSVAVDPAPAAPVEAAPAVVPAAVDPVKQSLINKVIDAFLAFLPGLMSFLAIYITHGVSFLWGKLSPATAASLSTVVGSSIAAICAAIFPGVIPPDVAAALGAGSGAVGHLVGQKAPVETK